MRGQLETMESNQQTKIILQIIGKLFWLSTSFACWVFMDSWGWGLWAIILALPFGVILSSLLAMFGSVFWLLSQLAILAWSLLELFS